MKDLNRYSEIKEKIKREIVLLKSRPCRWGKCSFCDYILDNSTDYNIIEKTNEEVLKKVTGKYKVLEVICSASVFELTDKTLENIKKVVEEKNIKKLFFEAHWIYRHKLDEIRNYFKIPIIFKTGVETFDNDFRERILKKGATFKDYTEVKKYFDSVCIMVGIKGQTKEMISRDMEIIKCFSHSTVNIFEENSTSLKKDEAIIKWFYENYSYLNKEPNVDVLFKITDFGVG